MTRRAIIVFGMLGLLVGLMAPAAYGKADTSTETVQGFTETFADANPCTGDTGDVTVTYNGIFHFTIDPNEGEHFTGTQTGTFVFEPDDPEKLKRSPGSSPFGSAATSQATTPDSG